MLSVDIAAKNATKRSEKGHAVNTWIENSAKKKNAKNVAMVAACKEKKSIR